MSRLRSDTGWPGRLCTGGWPGIGLTGSAAWRLDLPDATTLVLQGLLFANLLAWEALGGRIVAWRVKLQALAVTEVPVQLEKTHA